MVCSSELDRAGRGHVRLVLVEAVECGADPVEALAAAHLLDLVAVPAVADHALVATAPSQVVPVAARPATR